MKKIVAVILCLLLAFGILTPTVLAAATISVCADSVSGSPGEIVDVALRVSGNPGVNSGGFSISYDSNVLSFVNWTTNGDVFSEEEIDGNFSGNPMIVSALTGKENKVSDGELLTLHFMIREDAISGETTIMLTSGRLGGFTNLQEENVAVKYTSGKVHILNGQELSQETDATIEVTDNSSLYMPEKVFSFKDVKNGDWFQESVEYVSQKGLMEGTSAVTFNPEQAVTRAMLVTILWRLDGCRCIDYFMRFTDVPSGTWYTEAVRWAAAEKIVEGYSESRFGPSDVVTREQMAAILFRYVTKQGYEMSNNGLLPFSDAGSVSTWAKSAVQWACQNGILQGSSGKLLPKNKVTRAQAAAILHRFCESVE